ncbi:thioredoxin family protein [Thermodesulfobacteriota bacterium]
MEIKVLGPGCPNCKKTEDNVKEAIKILRADVQMEKVTDIKEIAKFGVFMTPAVVVDGEVKCVGKVPEVDDIKGWIER